MCEWGTLIDVNVPDKMLGKYGFMRKFKVDKCMADTLEYLWKKHGIETISSCCGHGKRQTPTVSIVVSDKYSEKEIQAMYAMIAEVDDRTWCISQWGTCLKDHHRGGIPTPAMLCRIQDEIVKEIFNEIKLRPESAELCRDALMKWDSWHHDKAPEQSWIDKLYLAESVLQDAYHKPTDEKIVQARNLIREAMDDLRKSKATEGENHAG